MSCSACRRDATPARAMIFCRRSTMLEQVSRLSLAGGGGFGYGRFFVEFAARHTFASGRDLLFSEEFGVARYLMRGRDQHRFRIRPGAEASRSVSIRRIRRGERRPRL